MTEDERKMVTEIHAALFKVPVGSPENTKPLIVNLFAISTALLYIPAGSPKDTRSLLEEIKVIVRAWNRGSWAARMFVFLIPAVATIGGAIFAIKSWFPSGGPQ